MNKTWLLTSLTKFVLEESFTSSSFKGPLSTQPDLISTRTGSPGSPNFTFPVTKSWQKFKHIKRSMSFLILIWQAPTLLRSPYIIEDLLSNKIIQMSTQPMLQNIQKYLRWIHNLFTTNKLSFQLEALSNCDNFTVITILYNTNVLTWDYKDNNKYQVTMS